MYNVRNPSNGPKKGTNFQENDFSTSETIFMKLHKILMQQVVNKFVNFKKHSKITKAIPN